MTLSSLNSSLFLTLAHFGLKISTPVGNPEDTEYDGRSEAALGLLAAAAKGEGR